MEYEFRMHNFKKVMKYYKHGAFFLSSKIVPKPQTAHRYYKQVSMATLGLTDCPLLISATKMWPKKESVEFEKQMMSLHEPRKIMWTWGWPGQSNSWTQLSR